MKILLRAISTTLIQEIDDVALLVYGKEILLGRGLVCIKGTDRKLTFWPRFAHHLFITPFSLCLRITLELKENPKGGMEMRYSVLHPLHVIIPLLFYLFLQLEFTKPIFYVPLILIAVNLSLVFFMQYPIFKRIIKQNTGSPT